MGTLESQVTNANNRPQIANIYVECLRWMRPQFNTGAANASLSEMMYLWLEELLAS
jgi:hypothetical protein